jgi:hypothetical protein
MFRTSLGAAKQSLQKLTDGGGVSRSALASKAPAKQCGRCLAPEMLCKICGGLVILSDLGVD